MIKLGERQELTIVKKVEFGVYLAESDNKEEKILLPKKELSGEEQTGDTLDVFVYRDSKDRLICTKKEPLVSMGIVGVLKVVSVSGIGAFLDWGLERDLFLPFREQTRKVKEGEEVLVSLYIDKSNRLCARMNVYRELRNDSSYKAGDTVKGRIYQISERFGAFVAVDDIYSALIPARECNETLRIGDAVTARITRVLEDGRLNLTVRDQGLLQIEKDAEAVLKVIDSYDGVLPFSDKASPEVIKDVLGMSKNQFKKAIGHLFKERKVEITEKSVRRL